MLIAAECGLFFTSSHHVQTHVFMFVSETYLVLFLVLQEYFYSVTWFGVSSELGLFLEKGSVSKRVFL